MVQGEFLALMGRKQSADFHRQQQQQLGQEKGADHV
jgi:hypothetical protein